MSYAISAIYRYPVKGLTPEILASTELTQGAALPGDRQFALALATTKFDPAMAEWLPKTRFLMLQRDAKLAGLRLDYNLVQQVVTLTGAGTNTCAANISTKSGRREIEQYVAKFMSLSRPPRLISALGHSFSDHRDQVISLINLRSIEALAKEIGLEIDPLRFRANIYFEGDTAWQEFHWIQQRFACGEAKLEGTSRIVRCAATNVDPTTAQRDLDILKALREGFGHVEMGIYARVKAGGRVTLEDRLGPAMD